MKTRQLLCFLFCCAFLFTSCVFKEVKELRSERENLKKENLFLQRSVNDQRKETVTLVATLDSLSQQVGKLKKTTPADLMESVDSLQKVVSHLQTRLNGCNINYQNFSDTIRMLKTRMRSLYTLPGNQSKRIAYNKNTYDCYIVDLKKTNIQFYWKDEKQKPILSLNNLNRMTENEQKTLVFATNAGMYMPNNAPQGLFIQNGKLLVSIDRKKEAYGNFYMQPNGIFFIDSNKVAKILPTDDFDDKRIAHIKFATQSGPMVVVDGEVNSKFKISSDNLNIRSGVGIIDSTHVVFIISNQRVNFYDFANVFKEKFKCSNALYLDGAISEMYLPELGRFQDGGNFGPIIGITKKQ
ncbi:MAG: phosphodiester glycosidase family protein [Saprospiraceae bacterium]